jgi:hypothetical protein
MAVATRFQLTDEEMLDLLDEQLPSLLERRPELEARLHRIFIKTFGSKRAEILHEAGFTAIKPKEDALVGNA